MTTTIEHDDRAPAAGVPRDVPAGARSRRSMLALAAVESGRLLRHPAVLAAIALSAWLLWRTGGNTWAGAHQRWALLLALALAAFAAASRDPAHRRLSANLRDLTHGLPRHRAAATPHPPVRQAEQTTSNLLEERY